MKKLNNQKLSIEKESLDIDPFSNSNYKNKKHGGKYLNDEAHSQFIKRIKKDHKKRELKRK